MGRSESPGCRKAEDKRGAPCKHGRAAVCRAAGFAAPVRSPAVAPLHAGPSRSISLGRSAAASPGAPMAIPWTSGPRSGACGYMQRPGISAARPIFLCRGAHVLRPPRRRRSPARRRSASACGGAEGLRPPRRCRSPRPVPFRAPSRDSRAGARPPRNWLRFWARSVLPPWCHSTPLIQGGTGGSLIVRASPCETSGTTLASGRSGGPRRGAWRDLHRKSLSAFDFDQSVRTRSHSSNPHSFTREQNPSCSRHCSP